MRVFIKWLGGADAGEVDLDGGDSVNTIRRKVAEKVRGAHPSLQLLVFGGVALNEGDNKVVRDYGISIDDVLLLKLAPPPRIVNLNVGGKRFTTTVATLCKVEGSSLARMFDGLRQHDVSRLPEGVPNEISTILVPCDAEGTFVIDRNGDVFQHVLDYLREATRTKLVEPEPEHDAGPDPEPEPDQERSDERGEPDNVALPRDRTRLHQLQIEARHYGLDDLAAMACNALASTRCVEGIRIVSLTTLARACDGGFTSADVAQLSDQDVSQLLQQFEVNILLAERIRREIKAERERLQGAELHAGISEQALTFGYCGPRAAGQGTSICSFNDAAQQGGAGAVGGDVLDPSAGPVFWKVAFLQRAGWISVGVIGEAEPPRDQHLFNRGTSFCWGSYTDQREGYVYEAGTAQAARDGWPFGGFQVDDVAVFKLEEQQLSVRVQRLGQTFTIPTRGQHNLRICVDLYGSAGNRVQVSRADAHELY